jgi:hypothetical protein
MHDNSGIKKKGRRTVSDEPIPGDFVESIVGAARVEAV